MSYQLSDIVTKVQQRVRDTNYSTTEIKNYLNDTLNDVYNEYRLPFMQTSQTYTLTVGVSDITNGAELPTDFVQAIDVVLTTLGREQVLPYWDIREVEETYPDPDDTAAHPAITPILWYMYGQTARVFPVPDSAYTLRLRYYKRPTPLSSDSDTPALPSEFEELLVAGAAYRVMQVKDNYDQAGVLENKYQELLDKLVNKYSQQQVGSPTRMRINRRALGETNF